MADNSVWSAPSVTTNGGVGPLKRRIELLEKKVASAPAATCNCDEKLASLEGKVKELTAALKKLQGK